MTYAQMPGIPQVKVPPIVKTTVSCCGYTCYQGKPEPWRCPGCSTLHDSHVPAPDAGG